MRGEEGHTPALAVSDEGSVPLHYVPRVVHATHTPGCPANVDQQPPRT